MNYKLKEYIVCIQRGISDDLFIRYFDEEYNPIINPKTNIGCSWLPISEEQAEFLKDIGECLE